VLVAYGSLTLGANEAGRVSLGDPGRHGFAIRSYGMSPRILPVYQGRYGFTVTIPAQRSVQALYHEEQGERTPFLEFSPLFRCAAETGDRRPSRDSKDEAARRSDSWRRWDGSPCWY
jgi:hypothetical protein